MDSAAALARWHAVVDSRDPAGLPGLIAEDAVFRSPAVHTPQEGRDTVVGYLTAAFTVLGPHLAYEREWLGDDSAVLQFRTEVGGLDVSGIDMITWDDDGQIVDFTVMVRRQPQAQGLSRSSSSTWARRAAPDARGAAWRTSALTLPPGSGQTQNPRPPP